VTAPGPVPPPPAPLIDEDSAGFWAAARDGRIALCRCTECRGWLARPLERCGRCAAPTSFEEVAGAGTIYSYIVVHHASVPAFAHMVPYVIALVEFDEGPRLPGILLGERGPAVAIGQQVRAELTAFLGAAEPAVTFRRAGTSPDADSQRLVPTAARMATGRSQCHLWLRARRTR